MENIKGKVIVITGASSGMGVATARKLAALGAKVVLTARREERLETLVKELGENTIYVKADVSRRADVEHVAAQTIAQFGKIDVWWNNAGIMPLSFFDEGHVAEWDRMIDINIKGVLYGIHAALPHMLERGHGHIITTSSTAGQRIYQASGVYSATKYAVRAIMETLREELAGKIKVTTIYPGYVSTELGHDITSPRVAAMVSQIGAMPSIDAEAIADAIVYAISQPADVGINDLTIRPLGQVM